MLRAYALFVNMYVVALGGCAREPVPPVVARDTSPMTDAAASPPEASPRPEAGASGDPIPGPMGFQDLRKPCSVKPTISECIALHIFIHKGTTSCAVDGTIAAIEWPLADLVEEPGPAQHLATREETLQGGGSERLVITADAVWMRASHPKAAGPAGTPSSSRSGMGTTWMGVLALLTDAQLEDAQVRAKYPRRPLLRTGAAWKEALIRQGPIPPRPAP